LKGGRRTRRAAAGRAAPRYARSVSRRPLPTSSVLLFTVGLGTNLVLALLPAPDIFQIFGTAARNLGLMIMGAALVFRRRPLRPPT
jgi:L-asparagine transporter-like permease